MSVFVSSAPVAGVAMMNVSATANVPPVAVRSGGTSACGAPMG
ncbi:MAG: hypothetical protein QOK16_2156 [Solirubrobacteraceae bacterium]|jgi:hypothetical protein|nr:hypothetical protein [Solirubrobacteraceae bacterium]